MDASPPLLRGAATDVLIEVVSKRMEPTAKISLVQQLAVADACERLSSSLVAAAGASKAAGGGGKGGGGGGAAGALGADEELLAKFAKLLAVLAGEVMDSLKRVENGALQRGPAVA